MSPPIDPGAWVALWDVAHEPFPLGHAGEGLGALAVLVLGVTLALGLRRARLAVRVAVLAAAVTGAGQLLASALHRHRRHAACAAAARSGEGRVLEGAVREFRPLVSAWQRPPVETFVVGGERVELPLFSDDCGYHRTVVEGGPFHEGFRVRLTVWEGQVVKVEVPAGSAPSAAAGHAAHAGP